MLIFEAVISLSDAISADAILGLVSSCDDGATTTASERGISYLAYVCVNFLFEYQKSALFRRSILMNGCGDE